MNRDELFNTLKVGDEVTVADYGSYSESLRTFATVTKTTKTQITLSNGNRYKKDDGREYGTGDSRYGTEIETEAIGGNWHDRRLTTRSETETRNQAILDGREANRIRRIILNNLPSMTVSLEQVKAIAKILDLELETTD